MNKEEEEEVPAVAMEEGTNETGGYGFWNEDEGGKVQNTHLSEMREKWLFEGLQGVKSWRDKNERWRAWWDLSNELKFGKNEIFHKNTQFFY